jgi:hypothetical protein
MRTAMTFTKIRNTTLLGVAGLGAAVGIAMGPAHAAHAAAPVSDTAPAAAPASDTSAASVPSSATVAGYDGALQPNGYYCGPAATRIALSAHGTPPSFDQLAHELGTTTDGTSSINEITRVLDQHRDGAYTSTTFDAKPDPGQTEKLRTDVIDAITHGDPVVANIVGAVTDNAGETHKYLGGHYLTITGYSQDGHTVQITDPADTHGSNNYQLPLDTAANWMATRGYSS